MGTTSINGGGPFLKSALGNKWTEPSFHLCIPGTGPAMASESNPNCPNDLWTNSLRQDSMSGYPIGLCNAKSCPFLMFKSSETNPWVDGFKRPNKVAEATTSCTEECTVGAAQTFTKGPVVEHQTERNFWPKQRFFQQNGGFRQQKARDSRWFKQQQIRQIFDEQKRWIFEKQGGTRWCPPQL